MMARSQSENKVLSYGRQCLDDDDRRAVLEVLESDWLTQGPLVEKFEQALSTRFETQNSIVVSSGTAALHLAALGLGWGPGDVVIVPAITFLASANCCAYVGAEAYFVDIDEETLTIDPNEVERHTKRLRAAGRKVRGVVGVDMAGHACDWYALREIADRYDLELVDDACHAMGGMYGNTKVGSCVHSDVTTLSFHPVKHITTAEGGAILTNSAAVAQKVARLRSHGTVRGKEQIKEWEGPWQYDMTDLGYNYRLTDLQCALGLSQIRKLDSFVERRRILAQEYDRLLPNSPLLRTPSEKDGVIHSYHLYIVRADFEKTRMSRSDLFARCKENNIFLQVHYRPVVLNSYYRNREIHAGAAERLPVSMAYYRQAVSLPMFPQLTFQDIERVQQTLAACLL